MKRYRLKRPALHHGVYHPTGEVVEFDANETPPRDAELVSESAAGPAVVPEVPSTHPADLAPVASVKKGKRPSDSDL